MGWLKKILEENSTVIDSWPEGKKARWGMDKLEHDLENFTRLVHLYEEIDKLKQALAEKDRAYSALMEQAVRFAQYIKDEFTYDDDPRFVEAEAFLKESESHGSNTEGA